MVDAVLYLFRHTHASDIRFLEAFHDDELGRGTPLNAVGVLSRPDARSPGCNARDVIPLSCCP